MKTQSQGSVAAEPELGAVSGATEARQPARRAGQAEFDVRLAGEGRVPDDQSVGARESPTWMMRLFWTLATAPRERSR